MTDDDDTDDPIAAALSSLPRPALSLAARQRILAAALAALPAPAPARAGWWRGWTLHRAGLAACWLATATLFALNLPHHLRLRRELARLPRQAPAIGITPSLPTPFAP